MLRSLITASALMLVTGTAYADQIDRRQAYQDHRIEDGRRNGSLTVFEAARLRAEQNRISSMERRAKADGVVTCNEARAISQAQREAGNHIYREAHDAQRSWFRKW